MSTARAFTPIDRRGMALLLLPLFAAFMMLVSPLVGKPANAAPGSYAMGYADGEKVGRQHGYTDAFKNAYRKSYVDELIRGGNAYSRSAKGSGPDQDYIRGYKAGYRDGYEEGWRSGRRDGSQAGREDARDWKRDLRRKMRECMRRGYGCWRD